MARGQIYAGKAVILIEGQDMLDRTLRTVETKMKLMSNKIGAFGRTAFTSGIFSATGQGLLIKRFAQYSDLILELRVKLGFLTDTTIQQEAALEKLEKRIRTLGRSTSYTTQEVAEGAIKLAQAGFATNEIEDMLQAVLDLARGTSTDLDNAARVMANTMRTFSISTEEAGVVVSQFVNAARSGTVEIDDLAESLKYASATAVTLGQSLPIVLSYFTLLSEKGMRGSIAGTSLNTALANMAKKMGDISKLTGKDLPVDAQGNLMLTQALINLSEATKDMPSIQRLSIFQELFNLRGNRAVVPIVTNEGDIQRLVNLARQIENSGDEARKAAEIMDKGLGGSIRRAVSAADDLNIALGKITEGPLIKLANAIPPLLNDLSKWIEKNQELALGLASIPALLVTAGAGALGLSFALRKVASVAAGLSGVGRLLEPLASGGLAARGVAGASAAKGALFGTAAKGKKAATPGLFGRMGAKISQYPVGAASAVPGFNKMVETANMKTKMDSARKVTMAQERAARIISSNAITQQKLRGEIAKQIAIMKATTTALDANKTSVLAINKLFQETISVEKASQQARLKNLTTAKATDTVSIGKFFNAKGLKALQVEEALMASKMMEAAKAGNSRKAAKYGQARMRVRENIARAAQGPKTLPFLSLESLEAATAARGAGGAVQGSKVARSGLESLLRERSALTARRATATETFKALRAKLLGGAASSQRGLRAATYATSAARGAGKAQLATKGMSILPQILKGIGSAGKGIKNIMGLATAFGRLSMTIGRFVMSTNGLTMILQILLLFGDRIPIVRDVLASLGNAFMGFFQTLGTLTTTLGPAINMLKDSFTLLGDQNTASLGVQGMVASLSSMAQIVGQTLVAAWQKFKMELGAVWDTLKGVISTVWELGKAIFNIVVNTIGNVLGAHLDQLANRFSMVKDMFMGEGGNIGGTIEKIALSLSTFIAQLFNWVGFFIMKANNMFLDFIDKMHIMLLEVLSKAADMFSPVSFIDYTSGPIKKIQEGMDARNEKFDRDVAKNDQSVEDMVRNMQIAFQSDAFKEGGEGFTKAFEEINKINKSLFTAHQELVRQAQLANMPQPDQPFSQNPAIPGMGQGGPAPGERDQVRRTLMALVGSAASTRGNVLNVTESEIKKQTKFLEAIMKNTEKQANMAFQ